MPKDSAAKLGLTIRASASIVAAMSVAGAAWAWAGSDLAAAIPYLLIFAVTVSGGWIAAAMADRAIHKLRTAEARLRAAAEALPDGLVVCDRDDRIVYYNSRYPANMTDSLRASLAIGKKFEDFLRDGEAGGAIYHPEMGEDFIERRLRLRETPRTEHAHRIADGRWIRIRENRGPDGSRVLVTTDITEERHRAAQLRLLALAVEQAGDPVEITGPEHGFIYVNRAFETTTGFAYDEVIGRQPQAVLTSGEHRPEYFAAMRRQLEQGQVWHGTIVNRHRDGHLIEQETTISPVRDEDGRTTHFVAVKRDVTEARAQARALAASEARYRAVVDTQTEFIVRIGPDGRWTFMNEAAERYLGMTLEEMRARGMRDHDLILPEDRHLYAEHLAKITPENPTSVVEWRGQSPDGTVHWEHWTDTGIFDADGKLLEVQCVGREITDRKLAELAREQAERALAEREVQFRTIAESVPVGLAISDIESGKPLYINPQARRNLGLEPDEGLASLLGVWANPAQREALVRELTATGSAGAVEADLLMTDGRRRKALVSARRITYGGREAMLSATVDVTEQRETEAALRESRARLHAFMDFAPVAAHLRDVEGRYLMFNRRMEEMIGVPAATALGRLPIEIRPPDVVAESDTLHQQVIETGRMHVSEQHLTTNMPEPRWAMAVRFPVLDEEGKVSAVGTFAVDITERKAAEAALQASEARLNAINAANPVPMNIARLSDRRLLFVNEPYLQLYALERLDLESFDRAMLYPDPAERDWLYAEVAAGREVNDHEVILRRADGSEIPVSLTSRQIMFQGEPAIVTTSVDMTALRAAQSEAARSREALHQSEKLTALGALLAGVAHELNNPLSVVVGYSAMLCEIGTDPETAARMEKIHAAAERCARIVRTFLAMARARPPRREPVALGEVVMGALELAAYGLRSADVEVVLDLPAELAPVHGDADQLHQVVVNLIVNAQQALIGRPAPRQLTIGARVDGEEAVLEVADNGPGMAQDVAKRAFEPFFTTKPQGVGTGVGLSVCHGIVAAHGGRIELETARGQGARFRVHLPLSHQPDALRPAVAVQPVSGGRVLVVDDEPEIAALLAERLGADGLKVVTASSGRRALAKLEMAGIDAVVSDLRMPDMDGAALADEIGRRWPELTGRILLITGDALGADPGGRLSARGLPIFEKPLDLGALAAELHRRIGGAATP
jgi:PAS domain S-box-containing protein